jgi:hypothetical protein
MVSDVAGSRHCGARVIQRNGDLVLGLGRSFRGAFARLIEHEVDLGRGEPGDFYRARDQMTGAVIVEGPSLIEARASAMRSGLEIGLAFERGRMLNAELSAIVAPLEIGRLMPLNEAKLIIERFESSRERLIA